MDMAGRPGLDLDGFRRSHFDALATQRFLIRMSSLRQAAKFEDVELAFLLTGDADRADEFLRDTLGDLASADTDTINTLATWIALECNTAATAAKLYTHRNTVLRWPRHWTSCDGRWPPDAQPDSQETAPVGRVVQIASPHRRNWCDTALNQSGM
jgi:PucR C-terminal helix-turn-helix domain